MNNRQTFKKEIKVPQLRIRSDLIAGQSVENCVDNWNYWRNEAYKKCGQNKPPQIEY